MSASKLQNVIHGRHLDSVSSEESSTNLLSALPPEIWRNVVMPFIPLNALARLDSSTCSKATRSLLSAMFNGLIIPGSLSMRLSAIGVTWLSSRRIYLSSCALIGLLDPISATPFLQAVRAISINNVEGVELSVLFDCMTNLQQISVEMSGNGMNDDVLVSIVHRHRELKLLKLLNCSRITDRGLFGVAEYCSQLESLALCHCRGFTAQPLDELLQNNSRLKALSFWMCGQLTTTAVQAIVRHCPNLESLDLCSCDQILYSSFSELAFRCKKLTALQLSRTTIGDSELNNIAKFSPNLTSLNIHSCNVSDEAIMNIFELNAGMKHFICGAHKFKKRSIARMAPRWTCMESLQLDRCALDDAAVLAIARHCAQLRTLWISKSKNVSDAALIALAKGAPLLEDLDINYCEGISDIGISAIAKGCVYLRDLKCGYIDVTDAGLLALAKGSRHLRSLYMIRCHAVTNVAINALKVQCENLTDLEYVECIHCDPKSAHFAK